MQLSDDSGCDLAIFTGEGEWAPYEANIDLDLVAGAFRTDDAPELLALHRDGNITATPPAVDMDDAEGEEFQSHSFGAYIGEAVQPIDLIARGDLGSDNRDGTDVDDEPSHQVGFVTTPAHARLEDSRGGSVVTNCSLSRANAEDVPEIWVKATQTYKLASQRLSAHVDGLEVERQILEHPAKTAHVIDSEHPGTVLKSWGALDGLDLKDVPTVQWQKFIDARTSLFSALRLNNSTVHAVCAGSATQEARDYVDAYTALIDVLLDTERYLAAYDKIVLCDAVSDPTTGEIYLAPTNPVSVEYMLTLSEQVDAWLPHADDVCDDDIGTMSIRHLLPYFFAEEAWYESIGAAPLPWRRYRPMRKENPGDGRPNYICRRIEHFLEVHSEYANERQVLALSFHEPGDGEAVLDALRQLVSRPPGDDRKLPRLDITIASAGGSLTALEGMLNGTAGAASSHVTADRMLRGRISVKHVVPHENEMAFAHLSFVFRSTLDRDVTAVPLDSRSGTLYCGGLAAVPSRYTELDHNETTFYWGAFPGPGVAGNLSQITAKMLELVGGMPRDFITRGRTRMPSTRISSGFLGNLYDSSVWVVHLDRLLGLEAFTPDATGRKARYLIDYEDRTDPTQPGLDAITATAGVAPYMLALRAALDEIAHPNEDGLARILRLFNGVSGEWALALVGASVTRLRERIGLATVVASLQDIDGGLCTDDSIGVVVPVDELMGATPRKLRIKNGEMCDDLLYLRVPLDSEEPILQGRLIEVKLRTGNDGSTTAKARQQLIATYGWLMSTFGKGTGPNTLFRSRDLAELIRASALRASAFGLIDFQHRRTKFEKSIDSVARGRYALSLAFNVGSTVNHGDFVSIELESSVPAHRQPLAGDGIALGHLRLGAPALKALAEGRPLSKPAAIPAVTFPDGREYLEDVTELASSKPSSAAAQLPEPVECERAPEREDAADASISGELQTEVADLAARLDAAFAKYALTVEPFLAELAQPGPSVIRFRTRALGKLSITEVERRSRDISREIAARGEIQVGDEPGFVTIDVPRAKRMPVTLSSVLPRLAELPGRPGALQFVIGVAPSGQVEIADLSRLPHLLVAGATGSGKSVFLRGLLVALLHARTPEQLQLLIIDPKRLDFAPFARAPHVIGGKIISDPDNALIVLRETLEAELERRQPILEAAGVSSASEFYESGGSLEDLPQLVILVDEFADLVLSGSDRKGFSQLIQRYAQLTRAYGIFLVLATQRPSVDVVTGSIKANLTARVAFSLPSSRDSMTVLDRTGAEDLLGNGDLLYYRNGQVERLQAPITTLADVRETLLPVKFVPGPNE
ncbi:FtsK/SpoIIIE domain-containing protein [Rhodococcus erythropolis]|uniref:FtsK/SpoIIIE domain-containing protein n=1 Tax=Rhodococcus erythropolis TaxID=1833 RepID=UPI001C407658|nr:FtsK/SpoIIIE domain-containing protein [Rhodococcus erythropolis]